MNSDQRKSELKERSRKQSKTKLRMVGAKVPDNLDRGLKMWAYDNNVSKSEAIRIAVDLLISPANRKDELFEKLDAIENKVGQTHDRSEDILKNIDVVRELIASLAKSVFYYAVEPGSATTSKSNMDARFTGYLRLVAKRILTKASYQDIDAQIENESSGGFL